MAEQISKRGQAADPRYNGHNVIARVDHPTDAAAEFILWRCDDAHHFATHVMNKEASWPDKYWGHYFTFGPSPDDIAVQRDRAYRDLLDRIESAIPSCPFEARALQREQERHDAQTEPE